MYRLMLPLIFFATILLCPGFCRAQSKPTASFLRTDTFAQGTWKGNYGADGYAVANDSTSYPTYAQVSFTGQSFYTWASSTADFRALQKAASSTDRIAACWYSTTSFTIDVNLTDGHSHQISMYCLDWDNYNGGRVQRIDVLDASNSNVLDTHNVSAYQNGIYFV